MKVCNPKVYENKILNSKELTENAPYNNNYILLIDRDLNI
jgi:hypothetical protein